jgi:hypothetical protein
MKPYFVLVGDVRVSEMVFASAILAQIRWATKDPIRRECRQAPELGDVDIALNIKRTLLFATQFEL